jgi:hypothetical protein
VCRQDGIVLLLASFETDDLVYLVFEACLRGDLYQLLVKEKSNINEHFVAHSVRAGPASALRLARTLNSSASWDERHAQLPGWAAQLSVWDGAQLETESKRVGAAGQEAEEEGGMRK